MKREWGETCGEPLESRRGEVGQKMRENVISAVHLRKALNAFESQT